MHYEPSPTTGNAQTHVEYHEPSVSEIPVHYEPALSAGPTQIGEADADEHTRTVQDAMLDEDEDGVAEYLNSDDSDENDEEDVHMPDYWNQDKSNVMTVHDGHESS